MIKHSQFKFPHQYFHLNFELNVFPHFKSLDWAFLCHNLNKCLRECKTLEIHALVMMDTHVHLLFRLPDQNENFFVARLLELLGQKCPNEILVEPIKNYSQYLNTYKYIYRNPVEAGLSLMCESYVYSTLNGILGQNDLLIHVIDTMGVIQNPRRILTWLNSNQDFKNSKLKELADMSPSNTIH